MTRTRSARRAEERATGQVDDYVAEPPRRRTRSADEYLVTDAPERGARDDLYTAGAAAYGPPPELRGERPERAERVERAERAERVERVERPERAERVERRDDRSERYRAERDSDYRDSDYRDSDYRDSEPRRASRGRDAAPVADAAPSGAEPSYRATAAAPPYIPSPSLGTSDLILEDEMVPADDTPTLVDLASRRAIRDATRDDTQEREAARDAATKARRTRRRKPKDKDDADEEYWGFLRGEAQ